MGADYWPGLLLFWVSQNRSHPSTNEQLDEISGKIRGFPPLGELIAGLVARSALPPEESPGLRFKSVIAKVLPEKQHFY